MWKLGFSVIDIKRTRGFKGLYQGHITALLRIFPYSGTKFATYETVHDLLLRNNEKNASLKRFFSGSVAGLISVTLCYPLELVHIRMVTTTVEYGRVKLFRVLSDIKNEILDTYPRSTYKPTARALAVIRNFYRGYVPTIIGSMPYNGVGFYTYHTLKKVDKNFFHSASQYDNFFLNLRKFSYGAISGAIALTISYPIEVVRRTIQARTLDKFSTSGHSIKYKSENSISITIARLYEKNGIKAFYSGLLLGYAKVIPTMAISFSVYELGKSFLNI